MGKRKKDELFRNFSAGIFLEPCYIKLVIFLRGSRLDRGHVQRSVFRFLCGSTPAQRSCSEISSSQYSSISMFTITALPMLYPVGKYGHYHSYSFASQVQNMRYGSAWQEQSYLNQQNRTKLRHTKRNP